MFFKASAHSIKCMTRFLLKYATVQKICSTAIHSQNTESTGACSQKRYAVHTLPALTDNYMYLLIDRFLKISLAVDPVEPENIMNVVKKENVKLSAVLTTHHHYDHAGGNMALSQLNQNLPIYGLDERIDALTEKLSHNQEFIIGDLNIKCLHTPCHTSGHVCYFIDDSVLGPTCFTGDTLFVGGCGKFFEGDGADMIKSLDILTSLPLDTKCYCGHEYTLNNLKFAQMLEPDNPSISQKIIETEELLNRNLPSVPTTIKDELNHNPFLRINSASIQKFVKESEPYAVMSAVRRLKDKFKVLKN